MSSVHLAFMVIDDLIKDCMSGCEAVCMGEFESSCFVKFAWSLSPFQRFLQPVNYWASMIGLHFEFMI